MLIETDPFFGGPNAVLHELATRALLALLIYKLTLQ